jgi:hypothetical protein
MYAMSLERKKQVFAEWMKAQSALELAEANASALNIAMGCAQAAWRNDPSLSGGVDALYRELAEAKLVVRNASNAELVARLKLPKRFQFAE